MSEAEWDECSWDLQRMYFEGMVADELIEVGESPERLAEKDGMTGRTVQSGDGVIDLGAMRDQLAAASGR
jgi:hypothetical protein